MNQSSFFKEAEALIKRGVLLKSSLNGNPVAYWHGIYDQGLCISFFHEGKWLNLYLESDSGFIEFSNEPIKSDHALYAHKYNSLPPVDGIFMKGSDMIGEFLAQYDWSRDEPFNDNFPNPIPGNYEADWQNNCPIYLDGIVAVSGGWHMSWPDDDWVDLIDHELILWTLEDAEPWIEVFRKDGEYKVIKRIT